MILKIHKLHIYTYKFVCQINIKLNTSCVGAKHHNLFSNHESSHFTTADPSVNIVQYKVQ